MLKVLLEQQRGVSKSTLHACLEDNTTWDLVHDVEKLRDLKIEKWQVFGDPEEARWCWCILNNAGVLLEFKKVLIMLMDVGQLTSQAGFPMLKLGKVSRLGRVFWSVFPISSAPPFSCGNAAGAAALYPHRFHQYSRNPTPPAALTEPRYMQQYEEVKLSVLGMGRRSSLSVCSLGEKL